MPQHTAMIRFDIGQEEMRSMIGPDLKEIMQSPREERWEVFVNGSESGPDAATWETELNRTLAER